MKKLIIFTIIATAVMITAVVAVATPNLVHADKLKTYCGDGSCLVGSNQDAKQACEIGGAGLS
jgi:hypothetical protein